MLDFVFIKTEGEHLKLHYADIVYIKGVNKYVKIATKKKYYLIPITMNNIEKMLPNEIFRRIHRSYIVSMYFVDKFDNNTVYLENKRLPLAKRYKESIAGGIIVLHAEGKNDHEAPNSNLNDLLGSLNPQ
jgi:two-component system LytT family response regulator